jgi:hypothetical protein
MKLLLWFFSAVFGIFGLAAAAQAVRVAYGAGMLTTDPALILGGLSGLVIWLETLLVATTLSLLFAALARILGYLEPL